MSTENIKKYCSRLRLSYIPNNIDRLIVDAQNAKPTYEEFLENVLREETKTREFKAYLNRLKQAKLPPKYDLDEYNFSHATGISERQLRELRQLSWLNQAYNIILMGPSGTGKTYIASGLIYDAIKAGKKAYMISMEDILTCLRTKDISTSALTTYNKWLKADLLAIDDIMLFPVKKEESASFFNLINSLHEKTSVIITTNKAPTEWVRTLNDEVLATAIIDRLLYRCEVIKLAGTSYRLENRKTIFSPSAATEAARDVLQNTQNKRISEPKIDGQNVQTTLRKSPRYYCLLHVDRQNLSAIRWTRYGNGYTGVIPVRHAWFPTLSTSTSCEGMGSVRHFLEY